ncbi:MAG: LacI family DNA-binding transcriptional regulator, partial [Clostridiales bacterium]|nr:LacI family DNA-binding transcriptional regulator [Clostridiales bacterium]
MENGSTLKVTVQMIADRVGVSKGTVDRALHNREGINEETKEKILEVA